MHICYNFTDYLNNLDLLNVTENSSNSKSNNVSISANVELSKDAAKEIAKGISNVGSNIGLGATAAGIATAVGKTIAKSSMPPLQKAGIVVGSATIGAGIHVAASAVNRKGNFNLGGTGKSFNGGISKFFDNGQLNNSPLYDLTLGIEFINYGCLLLALILFIQILFKFYLDERKIKLNLSNFIGSSLNDKLNYYLLKIIILNKKMSHFYI